jgi:hypothetical protein
MVDRDRGEAKRYSTGYLTEKVEPKTDYKKYN